MNLKYLEQAVEEDQSRPPGPHTSDLISFPSVFKGGRSSEIVQQRDKPKNSRSRDIFGRSPETTLGNLMSTTSE